MPNHYHLVLQDERAELSKAMQRLVQTYTQKFNFKYGRDGHLFRGRFKSIVVQKEEYLRQVVKYVHLNPVSAGMCTAAELYRWSSHRAYIDPAHHLDRWISVSEVLEEFGGNSEFGRQSFNDYINSSLPLELRDFYQARKTPAAIGSRAFLKALDS